MAYVPRFEYHDVMVHRLMEIARQREFAEHVRISAIADLRMRQQARQRSTHSSTLIEGNPIARKSIAATIADRGRTPSQAQMEIRNYWRALEWIAEAVSDEVQPSEDFVRRLHSIVFSGGKGRPRELSEYRSDQMAITDSSTGNIEYLAPEPQDVPELMAEFVAWWESPQASQLPAPIRAAIVAYRFVTIHPFGDGNGRTTRALATYELWRSGYAFRGYLALEDYYARNLNAYYGALQMGLNHNYYFGRHDPDMTPWLDYFTSTMLEGAREVRQSTEALLPRRAEANPLRGLSRRFDNLMLRSLVQAVGERADDALFTPGDVAEWFGVSDRTAREWLGEWRDQGHVEPASGDERVRVWRLAGDVGEAARGVLAELITET